MRTLLVFVLVLAAAGVGADRVAEAVATREAEQRLADRGFTRPEVSVGGFPFLTQLARREFGEVRVTAAAVTVEGTPARRIRATGREVSVPASDDVAVQSLTARAVVPYAEVARRAGLTGVTMAPAGGGDVTVRGDVDVLGEPVEVAGVATVRARGDRISVRPRSVRLAGGGVIPVPLRSALVDRFTVHYRLGGLPAGLSLRSVAAGPGGFEVRLSGRDLTFPR